MTLKYNSMSHDVWQWDKKNKTFIYLHMKALSLNVFQMYKCKVSKEKICQFLKYTVYYYKWNKKYKLTWASTQVPNNIYIYTHTEIYYYYKN